MAIAFKKKSDSREWLLLLAYIKAKRTYTSDFQKLANKIRHGHKFSNHLQRLEAMYDFTPLRYEYTPVETKEGPDR